LAAAAIACGEREEGNAEFIAMNGLIRECEASRSVRPWRIAFCETGGAAGIAVVDWAVERYQADFYYL
jgi:hypothetical protein